jgi:hypothetical protein
MEVIALAKMHHSAGYAGIIYLHEKKLILSLVTTDFSKKASFSEIGCQIRNLKI